jgi:hypothetical protein
VDWWRGVLLVGLTTTKVLIVNVSRRRSIHHGGVTICLPRVVEDRWRREVHRLTNGRVLDVVLSEQGFLTSLQPKELLINVLHVGTDLLSIVPSHIEASKESLRYKVENALLLVGISLPLA